MERAYSIVRNEVVFLVISILFITTVHCDAFATVTRFSTQSSSLLLSGEEEPDLFDYFDPLLSPHSYPNGISPDKKPDAQQMKDKNEIKYDDLILSTREKKDTIATAVAPDTEFFDPLLSPHMYPNGTPEKVIGDDKPNTKSEILSTAENATVDDNEESIDLTTDFISLIDLATVTSSDQAVKDTIDTAVAPDTEFFDPLLSPHMYPNGTPEKVIGDDKPNTKSEILSTAENATVDDNEESIDLTTDFISLIDLATATSSDQSVNEKEGIKDDETKNLDLIQQFRRMTPTISPHDYPSGTPENFREDKKEKKKKQRVVGVLLIDHGSRNKASNDRLEEMARLYQGFSTKSNKNNDDDIVLVEAAHMEIASPSIPDGLISLIDQGVDEIVCHPYFLSAKGRHVSEDIPEILDDAISSLNITLPIVTTEPVGSSTDIMLGAIESLVKTNLKVLRRSESNEANQEQSKRIGF